MGAASTGRFRTEGGAEVVLAVPLSPEFAGQQARGELMALDPDPEPVEPPAHPDPEPVEPPADRAAKAEWVAYAVAQGANEDEVKALTRDELVGLYGDDQR